MLNIFDVIRADENMYTLTRSLRGTELANELNKPGFYTVFAPSEIAFGNLHEAELDGWLKPENKTKLTEILCNHIVEGHLGFEDFVTGEKLRTINGKTLQVDVSNGDISINGSRLKRQNCKASNGIVYLVDTIF